MFCSNSSAHLPYRHAGKTAQLEVQFRIVCMASLIPSSYDTRSKRNLIVERKGRRRPSPIARRGLWGGALVPRRFSAVIALGVEQHERRAKALQHDFG